jgi:DNA invertase Pin-like site-specific DNA recombinase
MKSVIYVRCSTEKQQNSISTQTALCADFAQRNGFEVVEVISEIASGKDKSRPGFARAVSLCRENGFTLIASAIDRLARRISTIGELIDERISIRVVALGSQEVSKVVLAVFASLAEAERDFISLRTRQALANLKAQGVVLGNPRIAEARKASVMARKKSANDFRAKMRPVISEIQEAGITSHSGIARALNRRGYKTARNKAFYPGAIKHLLQAC